MAEAEIGIGNSHSLQGIHVDYEAKSIEVFGNPGCIEYY